MKKILFLTITLIAFGCGPSAKEQEITEARVNSMELEFLSTNELESKSEYELYLIRNEVYARKGFIFKSKDLQEYFKPRTWYNPQNTVVDDMLSDAENQYVWEILAIEARHRTQKVWIINLLVSGIVVIILFGIMLLRSYVVKAKTNEKLMELNEEISGQKETLLFQSDKLKRLNKSLNDLNETLESRIEERTKELNNKNLELEIKNQKLREYGFKNAHELRAPLAKLLGFTYLFDKEFSEVDEAKKSLN